MKLFKYLLISGGLLLSSCSNFLEVRPDGEVVNDALFSNDEGFQDALYGVYAQLAKPQFYGKNTSYYLNDILSQYFYHDYPGDITLKIMRFEYKDAEVRPTIDALWSGLYNNIANANNVLVNLAKKSPSELKYYNLYRAESLALRGFMHFEVLRYFTENIVQNPQASGIPYYTDYSFKVEPFLSATDSYNKIIADLKEAESILSKDGEVLGEKDTSNTNGFLRDRQIHLNLYAIQALLSRVYWTKGALKEAAEYAHKVIDSKKFELANKTEIEHLMNGVLSPKETIFGLYSKGFYELVRAELYQNRLNIKAGHEDTYQNDKVGADTRYEKWFVNVNETNNTGLRCVKVFDIFKLRGQTRPDRRVNGINLIRLPELYYILSEYYLSIGDQANAVKYFDAVLSSRGLTPYAERSGSVLDTDKINIERRKEFVAEGQFFHTQKRYNMDIYEAKSGVVYKGSKDIYVFPIPANEIDYRN